jgi:hypothetical protein
MLAIPDKEEVPGSNPGSPIEGIAMFKDRARILFDAVYAEVADGVLRGRLDEDGVRYGSMLIRKSDRRLVSVAYSALRPGETLALESTDVGKKTISATRAIKLDGPGDTKTHKARSISGRSRRPRSAARPSAPTREQPPTTSATAPRR